MKLYFSQTSPFARKIRVALRETDLIAQTTEVALSAWDDPEDLLAANPLAQVPALITADGQSICDSPLILEYIDTMHHGKPLFPGDTLARLDMRRFMAIADGISEAVFCIAVERRRPAERQHEPWVARKRQAAVRSLEYLARTPGPLDSGDRDGVSGYAITLACALAYCDLRLADHDWRSAHPGLADWFERFAARPSMAETQYV